MKIRFRNLLRVKQARQCSYNVTLWRVPVLFKPPWLP